EETCRQQRFRRRLLHPALRRQNGDLCRFSGHFPRMSGNRGGRQGQETRYLSGKPVDSHGTAATIASPTRRAARYPQIGRTAQGKTREGAMARARSAARASAKGASASGRAAIVTGGASGIGLACAEALLAAGWKVGILERDEKALDRARERFRGERAVRIGQLDVTDEPAAIAAVNGMAAAFGRLDGVLNSAGIGADVHVLDTPVDLFRKILDINVTGTFI